MGYVVVNIEDIIIPKNFAKSIPSATKYASKKKKFLKTGRYKPIVLKGNVLKDGYITYLVLKELGEQVVFCSTSTTCYAYGIHIGSLCTKEYVWRVPKPLSDTIRVGDLVLAQSQGSLVPVKVTRLVHYPNGIKPRDGYIKKVKEVIAHEEE